VIKYTILIPEVLPNKDIKNSHFINIPHDQRLVNINQAFKELTGIPQMCGTIDGLHIELAKKPTFKLDLTNKLLELNMTTIMWFCKLFVIPI
jgi:hypothetical protein